MIIKRNRLILQQDGFIKFYVAILLSALSRQLLASLDNTISYSTQIKLRYIF